MSLTSKKIKILFITSLLDMMGGAEKNLCDVVLHLNKDEFVPFVLAFKGGNLTKFLAKEKILVKVNNVRKLFSVHTLLKAIELWRFLRAEQIDVVVTYHHDADIFGSLVARLAGVNKVVSSRRDMGYQLQKQHVWFYLWFGWLFSHFITVSDAVKREVILRERVKAEKITTIYNGLETRKFHPCGSERKQVLKDELGLPDDKTIIGMVASFRPIKGQMYLVDAIAGMEALHDKILVLIVGYNTTDYFKEVQARVTELGLEDNFIFTGPRDDVPELLSLFDVFVISSINEGFSNAIIEAMAAGVPVVAANSGGNSEAVLDGETGLLFQPCDSNALAESLLLFFNDKQRMENFGDNGRKRVSKEFTLAQMIAANEAVYKNNNRKV